MPEKSKTWTFKGKKQPPNKDITSPWVEVICDDPSGQTWFDINIGFGDDELRLQDDIYSFLDSYPTASITIPVQET